MAKRKLTLILAGSMGLVMVGDLAFSLLLAARHQPFALPLLSMTACIPGFVVAGLAWRGRLRRQCAAST